MNLLRIDERLLCEKSSPLSLAETSAGCRNDWYFPLLVVSRNDAILRAATRGAFPRFVQVLSSEEALDSFNKVGVIKLDNHETVVYPACVINRRGDHLIDRDVTCAIAELHRFKDRHFVSIAATSDNIANPPPLFGERFYFLRTYVFRIAQRTIVAEESRKYYDWNIDRSTYTRRCRATTLAVVNNDDGDGSIATGDLCYGGSNDASSSVAPSRHCGERTERRKDDREGGQRRGIEGECSILGNSYQKNKSYNRALDLLQHIDVDKG